MRLAYIIPEFPGQTHVWMWREIVWIRRWDLPTAMFSTRRPPERDKARHAFAAAAAAETAYLWPLSPFAAVRAVGWALLTRPAGLWRCLVLALTLPLEARFRRLRLAALIAPACELARRCRIRSIDHLHSHGCANSAVLCMMVKRLNGTPWSMTLNANIEWWGGAMREKFGDAAFTVAITKWLLEEMRRDFPELRPEQALLGRIGVDTEQWSPGPRVPSPDGATRVITVARLHPNKGHDVLLDALGLLRERGVDVSLRIVGDGPVRGQLEEQARRLGLAGSVRFMGSLGQEQIIEEMRASDVFALASRFEPLGVAYMEAMSMEVATVGTRTGGVAEIVEDGVDGVLVPPNDAPALADAIQGLATDPAARARVSRAGRQKIVSQFDSRIGAATLYERLSARAAPSPGS